MTYFRWTGWRLVVPEGTIKKDILKIPAAIEDGDYVHSVSFDSVEDTVGSENLLTEESDSDGLKLWNNPPPFR